MSADDPGRSDLDPRYSASFQRVDAGAHGPAVPVPAMRATAGTGTPSRRPESARSAPRPERRPAEDLWSPADLEQLSAELADPGPPTATHVEPQVSASPSVPADAIAFVRRWGLIVSALAVAALVGAVLMQEWLNRSISVMSDFRWVYAAYSVVVGVAPALLAVGIALLVFAGYRRRVEEARTAAATEGEAS